MKICVYGAGAIGGHAAARLAKGGADVSVVARGAQLEAIRRQGLTIQAPDEQFSIGVAASEDPAALGPQDAVIVTVKAPALPSVAAGIGPLLGPETSVAFVMNGIPWWYHYGLGSNAEGSGIDRLDPGGALARAVAPGRVIGGVVYSACTVIEPGVVHVANKGSRIVLGEPTGEATPRLAALAERFRAGGWRIDETPRIRDAVWSKLMLNIVAGLLGIVSGAPGSQVLADPLGRDVARRLIEEGQAIAAAMGCTAAVDIARVLDAEQRLTHTPSIVQDLLLGRPMELDALYVVPQQMAREHGVATPTLDLLTMLACQRAAAAGLYRL